MKGVTVTGVKWINEAFLMLMFLWPEMYLNRSVIYTQSKYLSAFENQPVFHDWYVIFRLWDGAYKRTIASNRKE